MGPTRREMVATAAALALAPRSARANGGSPLIFLDDPGTPSLAIYERAISLGADFLTAPVVMSQDGSLVAAPDLELSAFTDVAARTEFAGRRATKTVDGAPMSGWFCEDFTLAELKTLAIGAAPRPTRAAAPPTLLSLQDVIDAARVGSVRSARVVGVSPRMIRPGHFAGGGVAMEPALARVIALNGYDWPAAAMIVQAAEPAALKAFGAVSHVRRTQLLTSSDGDLAGTRDQAEAIAPAEASLIQGASKGPMSATPLIAGAHADRLAVYARVRDPIPREPHDPRERFTALFLAGVDGVMCEDVALAVKARRAAMDEGRQQALS